MAEDFAEQRTWLSAILAREAGLQEVVQLVGPDALQDAERMVIEAGRMIREFYLQQSAFSDVDASCSLEKAFGMIKAIRAFYEASLEGLQRGMTIDEVLNLPQNEQVARFKEVPNDKFPDTLKQFLDGLKQTFAKAGESPSGTSPRDAQASPAAPSGAGRTAGDGRRS